MLIFEQVYISAGMAVESSAKQLEFQLLPSAAQRETAQCQRGKTLLQTSCYFHHPLTISNQYFNHYRALLTTIYH